MNRRPRHPRRGPRACPEPRGRTGSIYVLVLGTTLAVTLIGLSALMAARLNLRMVNDQQTVAEARTLARSGIEYARWVMANDLDWRTRASPTGWLDGAPFGSGQITVTVVDAGDGNLADDTNDNAVVTGLGEVGASRFLLSVELTPEPPPGIASLSSAVAAGVGLTTGGKVTADGPLSSNAALTVGLLSQVDANIESIAPAVVLGTVNGTQTILDEAKDTPGEAALVPYIMMGTPLSIAAMPKPLLSPRELSGLLGPCSNPYGATNANGVYYVTCAGQALVLKNLRVLGTLIILDPGLGSGAGQGVRIDHLDPTYPALLVRGAFSLDLSGTLDESKDSNFNPTDCPYEGVADTDTKDSYPVGINGIIYTTGTLSITTPLIAGGAIISDGPITISNGLTVDHDPALLNTPPPGFERTNRPMIPVAGSWQRVVN